MKNLVASFGLAAAGLLVALPSTASAAYVLIDFSAPGGTSFAAGDFENGFNLNGNLFQIGLGSPASTTLPSANSFSFDGSWIDLGASSTYTRTVYFVNPAAPTTVLGTFTFSYGTDGFNGSVSGSYDPNGIGSLPGGVAPGDIYLSDGSTYDFSGQYISMAITTVPTPGAAAAIGLAGAASLRRRRR